MSETITIDDDVSHENAEDHYGFDLTDFGDAESFQHALDDIGLGGETYIGRVETDLGMGRYVWADDDGMIVTGANPISGKHANEENQPPREGYASYIGIEGSETFVLKARTAVERYADTIEGRSGTREYI